MNEFIAQRTTLGKKITVLVTWPDGHTQVFGGNRATLPYLVVYYNPAPYGQTEGRWYIVGFRREPLAMYYGSACTNVPVQD